MIFTLETQGEHYNIEHINVSNLRGAESRAESMLTDLPINTTIEIESPTGNCYTITKLLNGFKYHC